MRTLKIITWVNSFAGLGEDAKAKVEVKDTPGFLGRLFGEKETTRYAITACWGFFSKWYWEDTMEHIGSELGSRLRDLVENEAARIELKAAFKDK